MKFQNILECDSSLKLVYPGSYENDVCGIVPVGTFEEKHMVFIKSFKFLKKILELGSGSLKQVGTIIDESVWNDFSNKEGLFEVANFVIVSKSVDLSMCELSKLFYDEIHKERDDFVDGRETGEVDIDPTAQIAKNVFIGNSVKIGKNVIIHPHCTILSNSEIGDNTVLYPQVTLYQRVKIGKNCRIHSSVIVGPDGFGYNFIEGVHKKIWHYGGVIIGNDVEIGSCTTVDAGTFVPTKIGDGSKIDNSVQVAHNCILGVGVIMCGHSGLSGSCTLGDYTVLGGKVGIAPDVELGKGCQIAGAGMVTKNWPDGSILAGHPARPLKEWLRGVSKLNTLSAKKKC